MSKVHVSLHRDAAHGKAPITGPMRFAPSRRRPDGADIILPAGFDVDLVDGEAVVELDATGPDWCWTAYEPTVRGIIRSFLVPDVPDDEVLEYSSLPDVDPATLEPSAEPEAAWVAVTHREARLLSSARLSPSCSNRRANMRWSASDSLPSLTRLVRFSRLC